MKKSIVLVFLVALTGCETGFAGIAGKQCVVIPDGYVLSDAELQGKPINGKAVHWLEACPVPKASSNGGGFEGVGSSGGGPTGGGQPGQSPGQIIAEGVKTGGGNGAQAFQIAAPAGVRSVVVETGGFSINGDGSITGMRLLGDVQ